MTREEILLILKESISSAITLYEKNPEEKSSVVFMKQKNLIHFLEHLGESKIIDKLDLSPLLNVKTNSELGLELLPEQYLENPQFFYFFAREIKDNQPDLFKLLDSLDFAYTDREIDAVNNARNKRDGFSYWINELGKESGILKRGQSMLCDNVDRIVVEMPACDTLGINSPIASRLKEQLDYLSEYENQNPEELISYKILFPYNVGNNSHWNVGEIIFEENLDGQFEVTTTAYDPFGEINYFNETIQEQITGVFESKYGKDRITFFQSQQKSIQPVQTGVACGLYTAIALHNLKTKSEDEIWDGVFDESGNQKDEKTLREEDIKLVGLHNQLSASNFCVPINEDNFVDGRQDRQNLTAIEQEQLTEVIQKLEQISELKELYKIFSAINNFLIGNNNDEEMRFLRENFQHALEEKCIQEIFFKNEVGKKDEFKVDICLLPIIGNFLSDKLLNKIVDNFSDLARQVIESKFYEKDWHLEYDENINALFLKASESILKIKNIEPKLLTDSLNNIFKKAYEDIKNEKESLVKRKIPNEDHPNKNPKIEESRKLEENEVQENTK
ncbi:MAG: hypothetical protein SFV53_01960 [Rickettsiales bacterium]|nr:hypothetical protein [Rickettsiales bacterium]